MKYFFHFVILCLFLIQFSCTEISNIDSVSIKTNQTKINSLEVKNRPKVNIEGASISLLVREPDIVTPTGLVVDSQDRIWVIENHTHARNKDYTGPEYDKIKIFENYLDDNPENDKIIEYASNFKDGMSLSMKKNGQILVATRASILQFTDNDNDLISDQMDTLIGLESIEKFSHNGMSGLEIGPDNKMYFQCGENFGAEYTLKGSDGKIIIGKKYEGGSLYRSNIDGSNIEKISTAVWNNFALTFDPYGNLFSVENDADSKPPCRLLHIVEGGNYGFKFLHGRDGLSPLTSWFGEVPGTLPMISGTGEAPTDVMHYELDAFGPKIKSTLLVAAWGDSTIQSFNLQTKGASFTSEPFPLVEGGRTFAPVSTAIDSKGGIIITDWASLAYPVNGRGKIWRINPINQKNTKPNKEFEKARKIWKASNQTDNIESILIKSLNDENELIRAQSIKILYEKKMKDEKFFLDIFQSDTSLHVKRQTIYGLHSNDSFKIISNMFKENLPFIHTAIIETFGKEKYINLLLEESKNKNPYIRLGALLCLTRFSTDLPNDLVKRYLNDEHYNNKKIILHWIAENKSNTFKYKSLVEESFTNLTKIDQEIFDDYMVTFQYLDGTFGKDVDGWASAIGVAHFMEGDEHISKSFYKRQRPLLNALQNTKLNSSIKSRALSSINPSYKELTFDVLLNAFELGEIDLKIEALRTMGSRINEEESKTFLRKVALDSNQDKNVRLEAISGISNTMYFDNESKKILKDLTYDNNQMIDIRFNSYKYLRIVSNDVLIEEFEKQFNELPRNTSQWRKIGNQTGNEISGSRIFHDSQYQCSSCHRIDGRGGIYGPDLSKVGLNSDRNRIIESILMPSDIIQPEYVGYQITTKNDNVFVGRIDRTLDSKFYLQMILANGERKAVKIDDIVDRKVLDLSLMPNGLHQSMIASDFSDLIEYLSSRK